MWEMIDDEKAYMSKNISLTGRLPPSLFEESADKPSSRPAVQDSVTSPHGQCLRKGSGSPKTPQKSPKGPPPPPATG